MDNTISYYAEQMRWLPTKVHHTLHAHYDIPHATVHRKPGQSEEVQLPRYILLVVKFAAHG